MIEAPPGATWHRGVDLIAVERMVRGVLPLPELTEDEQRYAALEMAKQRVSERTIAERLGVAERTVVRWKAGVADGRP
ncbi:helix-turn-helix domain containing protein [Streptomyces sp. SRF1]|uniref:helix-turn-helix domain-containing protein n=1 Tax=Streptomyces sp. SRF1 TaxID=1549642 RepID=UPI0025B0488F|nr:helix-turn-helix domain-containing protein [Streptomyces sp. SRF1]MDN3056912.1 helix-turn-helix domain containing protein [Streptomyces sp. SRF1]